MASLNHAVLGILILQIYVHAAPSDVSKLEVIADVKQADPKLDSVPRKHNESDTNSTETQRQKRWYSPYNFGYPPANPFIYPSFNKRDEIPPTSYGQEDPLSLIHRRILEIANIVRQPPPPPPPTHFPIYIPVLFIPPGDCNCNVNPTPGNDNPPSSDNNDTTPSVANRWPAVDDDRQNWGFVVNETDLDDDDEDFSRPISFDPVTPNMPVRPAPPVEHGTVQIDSTNTQSNMPEEAPGSQPPPTTQNAGPPQNMPPKSFLAQDRPQNSPPLQSRPPVGQMPPSRCDGAILTCCHQPQVVYDCFAIQGCPDFTSFGNPCDPNLILRVIERFQAFYGQRGG